MTVGTEGEARLGLGRGPLSPGKPISASVPTEPPDWRALVDFEQEAQRQRLAPSTKARLIRQRFGLTPPRYMWWLIRMLDWPEVRAYAPPFVARFRRVLDERHRRRWVDRLAV